MMDIAFLLVAFLVILLSVVVLVGSLAFFVWASVYFGRRAWRQTTRSHLYVPVTARVNRALIHRLNGATLEVEYEYGGRKIENRVITPSKVAELAKQSQQVSLRIDPDDPTEAIVDPAFHRQ